MATVVLTSESDYNDPMAQKRATCIPRCSNQWNISHLNGKMLPYNMIFEYVEDCSRCRHLSRYQLLFCFLLDHLYLLVNEID